MGFGKYMAMADKLKGKHKKAFDYVEAYSGARMCIGRYQNEKMMDLLDLLLTAQEEGQPAEKIVGTDLERFSREYFSDRTIYDLIEPFFSKIKFLAWFTLIFDGAIFLSAMKESGFNLFTEKTDISVYLGGILAGYSGILLTDLISMVLIKLKCFSRRIYFTIGIVLSLAAIWFFVFNKDSDFRIQVPIFPVILGAALYLVVFYALRLFLRYRKTGTFRKPPNQYDTGFFGFIRLVFTNTNYSKDPTVIKAYGKQYAKLNNKRLKKGLEPVPVEEFFCFKEMESKSFIVGFILCFVLTFIFRIINNIFENCYVTIALTVLWICALMGGYFIFLRIISNIAKKTYSSFPEDYQSQGLEFEELYEKYMEMRKSEEEEKINRRL